MGAEHLTPFTSDTAREAGAKGNLVRQADAKRRGNLKPFTSETARAAAAKSVEARRAKKAAQREDEEALSRLRSAFKRDDLGQDALLTAHGLIKQIQAGDVPIRNGTEAANVLKALVDIGRLEHGEVTTLHGQITGTAESLRAEIERDLKAMGMDPGVLDVTEVPPPSA